MKHHFTESAPLKGHNVIIISMDKGEVIALTLLDWSAAFDTIAHATLTDRRSYWYGISGQAQIWFSFYLHNKHQFTKIRDTLSDKVTFSYGVPQGSVLGPMFFYFIHYTPQLYYLQFWHKPPSFCRRYSNSHFLSVSNAKESLAKVQHCLMDVSVLMTGSKLKLSNSKTEFLSIGIETQMHLHQPTYLGVVIDSSLNFRKHISQTNRAYFYNIFDLRRIRKKSRIQARN